jgi:sodium-independent sulfate anion transporter 11
MKAVDRVKDSLRTDVTWHRTFYLIKRSARALPLATAHYLEDKVPIIGWLPAYDWRWILNDVIAGLTLGIMLIPQSIAYAQIATMPVQYGLMSAWLPATLYAFMGTSKGIVNDTIESSSANDQQTFLPAQHPSLVFSQPTSLLT